MFSSFNSVKHTNTHARKYFAGKLSEFPEKTENVARRTGGWWEGARGRRKTFPFMDMNECTRKEVREEVTAPKTFFFISNRILTFFNSFQMNKL